MCLSLVAALTSGACSGSDSSGVAPYTGEAYPDRRPSFEPAGRTLGYVPNTNEDTISVLDLDAMELLGTVPVGRDPVDIDGPRHLQIDRAHGLGYVTLSYPFSETSPHAQMQGETERSGYVEALKLSDLSVVGDLRVDPNADDIAFSPENAMIAVAHYDLLRALQSEAEARRSNLILIDPASGVAAGGATARRFPVCAAPTSTAFNADGSRAYVSCTGEDAIAVVDTASGEVLSRVSAGTAVVNKPYAMIVDAARGRLVTSNQVPSTLSVFELSDEPALLKTLSVYGVPMFSAFVSDTLLAVPLQTPNGAALFDTETAEIVAQVQYPDLTCDKPSEFSWIAGERLLLVCQGNYRPGAIVEVDPSTLEIQRTVSVGLNPERLAVLEP